MRTTEGKPNSSQQRLLRVIPVLAGHEMHGLGTMQIAKAVGCSPSQATRDLQNLAIAGFAEKLEETGQWRLAPKIVQIATSYAAAIERTERRVGEIKNRYTRTPN